VESTGWQWRASLNDVDEWEANSVLISSLIDEEGVKYS
jgi:hypothetical protein